MKFKRVTIQMEAIAQYFIVVRYILLYEVPVLQFVSVDEATESFFPLVQTVISYKRFFKYLDRA